MAEIVYLHGFASGPQSRKAQFFRERFQELGVGLEIPDLAEGDFEHLTICRQLGVVKRLAAGRPVALIGSSMGGYLAALYAARHPEVSRLVLMAPAFGFLRRFPELVGKEALATWKRTGSLDVYHYSEQRNLKLRYDLIEDGARYEDYPEVTQPTLILHGSRDLTVPVSYSQEFAAHRPNVTLEILDSDHELLNVLQHIWETTHSFLC